MFGSDGHLSNRRSLQHGQTIEEGVTRSMTGDSIPAINIYSKSWLVGLMYKVQPAKPVHHVSKTRTDVNNFLRLLRKVPPFGLFRLNVAKDHRFPRHKNNYVLIFHFLNRKAGIKGLFTEASKFYIELFDFGRQ